MRPSESAEAALDDLLHRVHRVLEDGPGPDDDELLAAFLESPPAIPLPQDSRGGQAQDRLRDRISRLPALVPPHLDVDPASRLPAGTAAHRSIGRAISRHTDALLGETRRLATEVSAILEQVRPHGLVDAGEAGSGPPGGTADDPGVLSTMVQRLGAIEARLARLEEAERDRGFRPYFAAVDFDDAFRGSRGVILDRYHDVADVLAGTGGPVIDLGCGRGELVELLITRQVEAWGVELNPELVDFCRSIFLDVRLASAHDALRSLADGYLGGIALIQVVEHLTAQQLADLVPLSFKKLRPGGVVVAETVNALSPYVFTRSFYLDPTHSNPVHPQYLAFLFRHAGFDRVEIQYRSAVPESDMLEKIDTTGPTQEMADQVNVQVDKLNRLLFAPQDYAVLAVR